MRRPHYRGSVRAGDFDDYGDVCYTLRVEPVASYIPACAHVLRDVPLALQDIMEIKRSSAPNSCSSSAWLSVDAMQVRGVRQLLTKPPKRWRMRRLENPYVFMRGTNDKKTSSI